MTTEQTDKPKEGWKWLINSKKWHYFRNGTSLCHKWANFGQEFELGNDTSPDNCMACKKALQKEREKASTNK